MTVFFIRNARVIDPLNHIDGVILRPEYDLLPNDCPFRHRVGVRAIAFGEKCSQIVTFRCIMIQHWCFGSASR
jgi:hypothetical protein